MQNGTEFMFPTSHHMFPTSSTEISQLALQTVLTVLSAGLGVLHATHMVGNSISHIFSVVDERDNVDSCFREGKRLEKSQFQPVTP